MKNKFENNWSKDRLNGKILSYSESEYIIVDDLGAIESDRKIRNTPWIKHYIKNYDSKGNITRETEYDSAGRLTYDISYCYNEMGNLVEKIEKDSKDIKYRETYLYGKNGVINEYHYYNSLVPQNNYKRIYDYDYLGNLIEIKKYDFDGNKISQQNYEYDQKRNVIEEHDNGIRRTFKYDDKGNRIESLESIVGEETLLEKVTRKYDDRGYLIGIIGLDMTGLHQRFFSYDDQGNTIEMKYSDRESGVKSTFKYDEMRNLIEENFYRGLKLDKLVEKVSYKYDYDNKGNWIMKIKFFDGKPKYYIERVYEYYD